MQNDSSLWFKIDTIEMVLFNIYTFMLARSVRDTMSGTVKRCGWVGYVFFQQQQDKTLISVRSVFLNYSMQIYSPQT